MHRPHPPPEPDRSSNPGVLVITGSVAGAAAVRRLCEQLGAVMASCGGETVICDVHALPPSTRALEALARLQLTARRAEHRIRLQRAAPELLQLLAFAGLAAVIPYEPLPVGQRQRQAKQREDPLDVEEAVDRGDPPV